MIVRQKSVYYCDFCRKHGLSRPAMEKHERVCTLNPARVCRWKIESSDDRHAAVDLPVLVADLRALERLGRVDVDRLEEKVDGCPACMLAALRQSGHDYHYAAVGGFSVRIFDYDAQVAKLRDRERESRWDY